jgi:prepilin signal peptidase PulO-like enzyme (type II secretory pathway)
MPSQLPASPASQPDPKAPMWLRVGFWISIGISVAVVFRRIVALTSNTRNGPPQMSGLDDLFASHTALTLAHILPALLFVFLLLFIVLRPRSHPGWIDSAFYPLGAIVGLTAYAMSSYAVGGWTERSAVLLFDSLFFASLTRAFIYRSRGNSALERRWQLRAIAILLGIATTRPVMVVFFATARLTHLLPQEFFGMAFWIGFSINVLLFESWIRSVDRHHGRTSESQIPNSFTRRAT